MCDLTQFIISSIAKSTTAESLATLFMEEVVLSFGMVAILVVDADSRFLGAFEAMCKILRITFWPLARGNHKGLGVEKFHRFLNKTQAIAGQDRDNHEVFLQNTKTSQYAWNSAPIDDTDVMRSVAALGREFRFPMDTELIETPVLNSKDNSALFKYLRDVSTNSTFSTAVLQILVEERRTAHRERWNKGNHLKPFQVGDVVKVHIQIQFNADEGLVKKTFLSSKRAF